MKQKKDIKTSPNGIYIFIDGGKFTLNWKALFLPRNWDRNISQILLHASLYTNGKLMGKRNEIREKSIIYVTLFLNASRGNSHECMHVLIVVASIRYPLHRRQVRILLKFLTRFLVIILFWLLWTGLL